MLDRFSEAVVLDSEFRQPDGHRPDPLCLCATEQLTQDRWRIYSDNIAMTRWLQKTVQGMLNDELSDASIPVTDAAFDKAGDARDFWSERAVSRAEEAALTWYDIG